MAAGITAGSVAAGVPIAIGLVRNMMPNPLDENDVLHTENGCFRAQNGNLIHLQGINLNDELFFFKKDGMDDVMHACHSPSAKDFDILVGNP